MKSMREPRSNVMLSLALVPVVLAIYASGGAAETGAGPVRLATGPVAALASADSVRAAAVPAEPPGAEGQRVGGHSPKPSERDLAAFLGAPIPISSIEQLQCIGNQPDFPLDGRYLLTQDLDASDTANWNEEAGFAPIGTWDETDPSRSFTGTFDGQGHVISGLTIQRRRQDYCGLFGAIGAGGSVRNLGIQGGTVSGNSAVGCLAGGNHGQLSDCWAADAAVTGYAGVGGLVGTNGLFDATGSGVITRCHAVGTIVGHCYAGGLVGWNGSRTSDCCATGRVTASTYAGGLLGGNLDGMVSRCWASGPVTGESDVGGLAGMTRGGALEQCYASGSAISDEYAGGLAGSNNGASISQCFATGPVAGNAYVGGLTGWNEGGAVLSQCYAAGAVVGRQYAGGLSGENGYSVIEACFWDTEASGMTRSEGGTGLTTALMQTPDAFVAAGWDFDGVWASAAGVTYPWLRILPPDSPQYALSTVSVNGTISTVPESCSLPAWSLVWVTAEPAVGHAFAGWTGTGLGSHPVLRSNPFPLVMTSSLDIEAVFLPKGPRTILGIGDLQRIGYEPQWPIHWDYVLGNDIDASETAAWNHGAGFVPIGTVGRPFAGVFDGQGHFIRNLVINRPYSSHVGLFGIVGGDGVVRDLGLMGGSVSGVAERGFFDIACAGALAGESRGVIERCFVTTAVTGVEYAGGLIGFHSGGKVSRSYATSAVTGNTRLGGLIGSGMSEVAQCYAAGPVSGSSYVGGLVGQQQGGSVSECYAAGRVSCSGNYMGGLIGHSDFGEVDASFWDVDLSGTAVSSGGDGLSTAEMQTQSILVDAGWDFGAAWYMLSAGSHPYLANPPQCTVPNVTGMPEAAAIGALEDAGFQVRTRYGYDDAVPQGNVLSQGLASGSLLNAGIWVVIEVSLGPEPVPVPGVEGLNQSAAEMAITAAGLIVGTVTREYSDTVPAGIVFRQDPAAGTEVLPGSAVALVVSMGPETVLVPDVAGLLRTEAETALANAGLVVTTVVEHYSETVPAGVVIGQSPPAGTVVSPNSGVALAVSLGPEPILVPDVAGLSRAEAETALTNAGLAVGAVTEQYSETVPPGMIIRQNPPGGTGVPPGAAVGLVVSLGPEPVPVPVLTGLLRRQAATALASARLVLGAVMEEYNSSVPAGRVVTQSPSSGTLVLPGTAVALIVSLGPEPIPVPNVAGLSRTDAEAALGSAGFVVDMVTAEHSLTVPAGRVIAQTPSSGVMAPPGTAVALVVSLGPGPAAVPDVAGLSRTEAEAALADAGLLVGIVTEEYSSTVPAGEVIRQAPLPGAEVLQGSSVDLHVSLGPKPVAVPDVVGSSKGAALAAIKAAGLSVGMVTWQYSDTVPSGHVSSQAPAAGTIVLSGATVDLVMSLGREPVRVPKVVGLSQAEAESAIAAAGLAVGTVTEAYSDTVPAGAVISQFPGADTHAAPGSAVALVVSRGRDPEPGATPISSITELQRIGNDPGYPLDGTYYLTHDIDASRTATWDGGAGFKPIGIAPNHFAGVFDGKGHVVCNVVIRRASGLPLDRVGLFGSVGAEGVIRNLGIENAAIEGRYSVGALAGHSQGTVSQCYAIAEVAGDSFVGGLAGFNAGSISRSYAAVRLSASSTYAGGLTGWNDGLLSMSYALGDVTGNDCVGGLIGWNSDKGSFRQCYTTCTVTGRKNLGALVGVNHGSSSACFWDTEATGIGNSQGGNGLTTSQMQTPSSFVNAGWDFDAVWCMRGSYPSLLGLPLCELAYGAGPGGSLDGPASQAVNRGANGATVTAVGFPGFAFAQWSDGVTDNPRTDVNLTENIAVTASFEQHAGALKVTLAPQDAIRAGAQWRLAGTEEWRNSGDTESDISPARHSVEFKDVAGWNTPATQSVTIANGETATAIAVYTKAVPLGALQVTIAPQEAIDDGAQWRRLGTAPWRDSAAIESEIPPGAYTIEFKPVLGWHAPAGKGVTVYASQTAHVSGVYSAHGDAGGCNASMKRLQPFAEVSVFEPVMPSLREENGTRVCGPLTPLAIRLRCGEAIVPESVWGTISWGGHVSEEVAWLPLDAEQSDGWAVHHPQTPWPLGDAVTFTAGAHTLSGVQLGPFTHEFVVSGAVYEGPAAVAESGEALRHAQLVDSAYEIFPDTVYTEPVTIQLPVPAGVDASALEPAYLFREDGAAAWVSGAHVAGWLEPDSIHVVHTTGGVYVEFQVRHGGIVQLRRPVGLSPAGMNGSRISGGLLLVPGLGGFLLLKKRSKRHVP